MSQIDGTIKIRRFDVVDRTLHIALMVSFLGLALSGMPLLFADRPWAPIVARAFGGYGVSGTLHRISAAVMFITFFTHLGRVTLRALRGSGGSVLWGPDSLVPMPHDVVQLAQHVRWFLGRGPYPRFDRYTYWEKFDYWAVFWGMAIIGFSGLVMWFPGLFLSFLPGWTLNVALVVHSEEALLAMVFIFTVHFFNGHLRPGKFPMDPVIFTGEVSAEELRYERPAEYERLERSGRLVVSESPGPQWLVKGGPILGAVAVTVGWIIVFLTAWSFLRH
jgi:cytochrome b subunit of formate dehydrogenase